MWGEGVWDEGVWALFGLRFWLAVYPSGLRCILRVAQKNQRIILSNPKGVEGVGSQGRFLCVSSVLPLYFLMNFSHALGTRKPLRGEAAGNGATAGLSGALGEHEQTGGLSLTAQRNGSRRNEWDLRPPLGNRNERQRCQ